MWIKVCGVTRAEDVEAVVHSRADAIGFNFYPGSKRFVSIPHARNLIQVARNTTTDLPVLDLVGVFVNADAQMVRRTADETGLSVIQIHGDETAEQIEEIHQVCPTLPLIRALRVDPLNAERAFEEIDFVCARVPLAAVLLDAFVPGIFGGTGQTVEHSVLQRYSERNRPPLLLAGGLTPENVTEIAGRPGVWGIDTASGVESFPGIKNATLIRKFVNTVRNAISEPGVQHGEIRIGKN